MLEDGYFLLHPVFKYPEIVFFQISDGMILLIGDIDVHLGEIHVHIEFKRVFLRPQGGNQQDWNEHQTLHFHHHYSNTGGILAEWTR